MTGKFETQSCFVNLRELASGIYTIVLTFNNHETTHIKVVFTSLDAQKGWDGTYHGLPAKEGVFGWKLEYKAENTAEKKVLTGHANLLR